MRIKTLILLVVECLSVILILVYMLTPFTVERTSKNSVNILEIEPAILNNDYLNSLLLDDNEDSLD